MDFITLYRGGVERMEVEDLPLIGRFWTPSFSYALRVHNMRLSQDLDQGERKQRYLIRAIVDKADCFADSANDNLAIYPTRIKSVEIITYQSEPDYLTSSVEPPKDEVARYSALLAEITESSRKKRNRTFKDLRKLGKINYYSF